MANLLQRAMSVFRPSINSSPNLGDEKNFRPVGNPPAPVPGGTLLKKFSAFDFGRSSRRLAAIPATQTSINTLIRTYGRTVIGRSRYICSNNPYAVNAKLAYTTSLIGKGIEPTSEAPLPAERETLNQLFSDWTVQADADGLTNFTGLEILIASEMFEAGECFIRFRTRRDEDGLVVPLQIQLIPSEMLPYEKNEITSDAGSARIEMGIEFDALGRRLAYHFAKQHPGTDFFNTSAYGQTVRVPASEVLHLYRPTRVGQIRGVPHTLSALMRLALMDLYDDAELERKRTAALFACFIHRPLDQDADHPLGELKSGLMWDERAASVLEPGAVIDLEPGEDVRFAEPADVGSSYDPFQYRNLLAIAAGFGVPYYMMTGDLRQNSYSSIRAGELYFRQTMDVTRKSFIIPQFVLPVWRRILMAAAMQGDTLPWTAAQYIARMRELSRCKVHMPRWPWIDPLADVKAEREAVAAGFKARSDTIEESGYDAEAVDTKRAADKDREEELGLSASAAPIPEAGAEEDTTEESTE